MEPLICCKTPMMETAHGFYCEICGYRDNEYRDDYDYQSARDQELTEDSDSTSVT